MIQFKLKNWTSEKAYIFGLCMANGSIQEDNIISIYVKKKDKYIIKKIANKLGYKERLQDPNNKQIFKISFILKSDKLFSEFLNIPSNYLPDFIRGYFDGKGEIKKIKNNRLNISLSSNNLIFLQELLELLKKEANIERGSIDLKKGKLFFGTKDSIKLGEYMYKNNPELFLLRKRQKFNL